MKKNKNRKNFHLVALFLAIISLLLSGFSFLNASAILTETYQPKDREEGFLNSIDVKGIETIFTTDGIETNLSSPVLHSSEVGDLDMTPEFKFNLSKGEILSEVEKISGSVKGADGVAFYAIRDGSIDPKYYLGKAKEKDDNKWALEFDFSNFPNDRYKIVAKVKNKYGEYVGGSVVVEVKNEISKEASGGAENSEEISKEEGEDGLTKTTKDTSLTSPSTEEKETTEGTKEDKESVEKIEEEIKNTERERSRVEDSNISAEQKQRMLAEIEEKRKRLKEEYLANKKFEMLFSKKETELNPEEKEEVKKIKEKFMEDADGDGVSDYEEVRMGTDPFSADTDKDGFIDGDEVKNGFDPLKFSPGDKSDKVVFEEPIEKGEVSKVYRVLDVQYQKRPKGQTESLAGEKEEETEEESLVIKGKALPESFVVLYIYSSGPIVVTVKTDKDGNWEYVLDKELEDGEHKVYAAVTDNTGKITAKSEPFVFVKKAQAITNVTAQSEKEALPSAPVSPVQKNQSNLVLLVLLISFISLFLAILSIWLFVRESILSGNEKKS